MTPVPDKAGFYTAAVWERIRPDYERDVWKEVVFAISYDGRLTRRFMTINMQRHLDTVKTRGWIPMKVKSKHKDTRSMIKAMDRWATKRGFRKII